jgi:glycosyltransferase involved in cell wall biosynthesis
LKPSLLLVGNFLSSAGANRSVGEEMADHLRCAGYPVRTTSHQRLRPLRLIDMVLTIWAQRSEYQIAHVEVYSGRAFLWAESACWLLSSLRKPYILTLHGGNLPTFASRNKTRVKRFLQKATVVTAPSQYLQENMHPYRNDILLVANPLHIKNYSFRLPAQPKPHLIWLRAFHQIYHPQMAVDVMARLKEFFPGSHLTMIGPDKGDGSLQETQQLIDRLGLWNHITIVPGIPKNQVPKFLEQADIFINTTSVDNTPVSVMEAMACGLCIVSTNAGGIPYLIEHEKDALLVRPDAPDDMTNAIRRILTQTGLAQQLSINARRKVEHFDWSVTFPQWESIILSTSGMTLREG